MPPRFLSLALLALPAITGCGPGSGGGTPLTLLDYQVLVPPTFVARPPTSSMRLAEFAVPRTDGTSAEVIVFYFGQGQGGTAQANVERWATQFTSPEGGHVTPRVGTLDGTPFPTTVAEFEGNYARGVGAGPGTADAVPDQGLIAAVVETPSGSLFFQLVGDRSAVAEARADFFELVGSISAGS